jgi:hypothetical protein
MGGCLRGAKGGGVVQVWWQLKAADKKSLMPKAMLQEVRGPLGGWGDVFGGCHAVEGARQWGHRDSVMRKAMLQEVRLGVAAMPFEHSADSGSKKGICVGGGTQQEVRFERGSNECRMLLRVRIGGGMGPCCLRSQGFLRSNMSNVYLCVSHAPHRSRMQLTSARWMTGS